MFTFERVVKITFWKSWENSLPHECITVLMWTCGSIWYVLLLNWFCFSLSLHTKCLRKGFDTYTVPIKAFFLVWWIDYRDISVKMQRMITSLMRILLIFFSLPHSLTNGYFLYIIYILLSQMFKPMRQPDTCFGKSY